LRVLYENRTFNVVITRCRYCMLSNLKPLNDHKTLHILTIYFNLRLNLLS
jgi:hypothetical protein